MRDDAWVPSTRAHKPPSAATTSVARASSGLPAPRRRAASNRTFSLGNSCSSAPSNRCNAGQSSCNAVIAAATGLPGKPKNGTPATSPQAKGRPGFKNNFQKRTWPSSSTRGRIQSLSPADTPPVLTTTSQSAANCCRAARKGSGRSATTR